MTRAITKTWLRRQHKQEKSTKSFRVWARKEGRSRVEHYLQSQDCKDKYPDGVNYDVAKLTGLPESERCELKRMELEEVQKARKARSRVRAAATRSRRHERSGRKRKK
ncbi:MAG: hypothetical protein GTO49_05785 [Anaerolineae bacterium]|nr:hypothetical protein [Anaerolineae bacterium]